MTLDLRIPLGLLFTIVGAILFVFGFVTRGSDLYLRSAGMDINLIWGLVMLVFGVTMYLLGRRADKHPPVPPVEDTARPLGHGH
jgi:multisubunit Na+/H+ antiporter MnhG subunit